MSAVVLPDLNALPVDALRALILAQHEQLISREREIEHLQLLLAKLQRMQFGRKSEKLERQIEQLELRLEELESKRSEQEPDAPTPAPVTASSTPDNEAHAPSTARSSSATNTQTRAEGNGMPGMSGRTAQVRRGCLGDAGVRARQLRGDSSRAHQAELHEVRLHRAGRSAEPTDCARHGRGRDCWRTFWLVSTAIIFRCIGNPRCTRVRMWNWSARPWRTGWAEASTVTQPASRSAAPLRDGGE